MKLLLATLVAAVLSSVGGPARASAGSILFYGPTIQGSPDTEATLAQAAGYDVTALRAAHPRLVEGSVIRKELALRGIQYGPAFEGLVASGTAHEQTGSVLAEVRLPGILRSQSEAYVVHPALLDACFQSVAAHAGLHGGGDGGLLVPLHVRRLRVHGSTRTARYCYTRITDAGAAGIEADLDVLDEHGTVLLTVAGLQLGTGIYGSTFFMLTGFHGLHVTIGAIMLTVIWFRVLKGHFTPKRHFGFEAVAWYGHFVDAQLLRHTACGACPRRARRGRRADLPVGHRWHGRELRALESVRPRRRDG